MAGSFADVIHSGSTSNVLRNHSSVKIHGKKPIYDFSFPSSSGACCCVSLEDLLSKKTLDSRQSRYYVDRKDSFRLRASKGPIVNSGFQSFRCHIKSDHDKNSHMKQMQNTGATPGPQQWAYRRTSSFNAPQGDLEPGGGNVKTAAAISADYTPLQISSTPSVPWTGALSNILVACIAAALFGYHMGIVNGPLEYIARDLGFAGNALLQGFVVSIFLFGAFFGCWISSTVADGLGRRRSLQLSALPILAGTLLSATASSAWPMMVGRCLCGFGLGLSIPVMALYISEISPTAQRGTYGCLSQVSTCFGILAVLIASLPLPYTPGWWRVCFWLATIPAALLVIGMEFCFESPRWLAKNGRWNEVERAVDNLWGPTQVKSALTELRGSGPQEGEKEARWGELLGPRYIKVITIGAAVFGLQQLAGINAIFYFSSTIFSNAGIKSDMAASTVMGVVNLVAALASTLLMDRLGRKKLMTWSFAGMAEIDCWGLGVKNEETRLSLIGGGLEGQGVAMVLQAVAMATPSLQSFAPAVSVFGTLAYVVAFTMGAGPVPALLLPEIFPSRIRAKGMAVSMCVHWVFNFLIGLTFLPLLQYWGAPILYSCFAAVCFVAVIFTQRQIIETKGRSLEEIERLLISDT